LRLTFTLEGEIGRLRIPPPSGPERKDGLWQHTCFEAFVRPGDGEAYYEINLSPSGQWAAYHFDRYRAGMADAELPAPRAELDIGKKRLVLVAMLAGLPVGRPWRLGLSAVVEAMDGAKSYWAIAHPPGKPDFHHEDCFALRLPPAG
jgi:hypothetical protein